MRCAIALAFVAVLSIPCLGGQKTAQSPVAQHKTVKPDSHTSANALDWDGAYEGVVPCADCEGIRTVLILNKNMTYRLSATYLGKSIKPIENAGSFTWNEAGNMVILSGLKSRPDRYFVGEGWVLQLDMKGNRIQGGLAEKYRLGKKLPAAASPGKAGD
jgi:copper homeostasis protein (lipoprotein)